MMHRVPGRVGFVRGVLLVILPLMLLGGCATQGEQERELSLGYGLGDDHARQRLKLSRVAVEVFIDINREDLAHQMEYALHSQALALEGRNDEEAREVMKAAPGLASCPDLLAL